MPPKGSTVDLKRKASPDRDVSPPPLKRQVQSTTTNKAVANFFTPTSQKEPSRTKWTTQETLLIGRYVPAGEDAMKRITEKRRRVAAFDLDSTLILPKSGRKLPSGGDPFDWKWLDISVPETLRKLDSDGFAVVIFTNQGGLNVPTTEAGRAKRTNVFKQKVDSVLEQLDLFVTVFAATGLDHFRKPRTGMWMAMLREHDMGVDDGVELQSSFFVGDAGGRLKDTEGPADHGIGDRYFAANVGIEFFTPEEYFFKKIGRYYKAFDPHLYLKDEAKSLAQSSPQFTRNGQQDLVVLCGSPGAGKSTYYWAKLEPLGYERVNQDILKTVLMFQRCYNKANELLDGGYSVAIDATNANADTRSRWIQLAKNKGFPTRCIHLTANMELAMHNDAVRAFSGNKELNPEDRVTLPYGAFASYVQRFQKPSIAEGFEDITEVEFRFEGTAVERSIWTQHWA